MMSFWSSETLIKRVTKESLVEPFQQERVKHAAYELGLGNQVFRTSDNPPTRTTIPEKEQLNIPPGQFALLISQENIRIPLDAIGLISIKAGIKFKGLVNISGFHVDPGFTGRLKFSVFNAGGKEIILEPGDPTFLLWFASLDKETVDEYQGNHQNQNSITTKDATDLQGEVPSPAALDKRLTELELKIEVWKQVTIRLAVSILVALLIGLLAKELIWGRRQPSSKPSYEIQHDLLSPNLNGAESPLDDLQGNSQPPAKIDLNTEVRPGKQKEKASSAEEIVDPQRDDPTYETVTRDGKGSLEPADKVSAGSE